MPLGRMTQQASRYRYPSIFFLMLRTFSCLRFCPRQKLRVTEDFTILSLQRSSVRSNIQRHLGLYVQFLFVCCTKISSKDYWRNSYWDACSYSPTTPQFLISRWSCLWSRGHLTQCPSRTCHDKGRVFLMLMILLFTYSSSRSQSTCFKARRLLLSNLALTVENREMPRYAAWPPWLHIPSHMLPYRYVLNYFSIPLTLTLNRHASLWVQQVHGLISMGRLAIPISTGEL